MMELLNERVISAADDVALSRGGLKSNYERLFDTPERAARTLARACGECDENLPCCECPLSPIVGRNVYEPEILEWLRGDA